MDGYLSLLLAIPLIVLAVYFVVMKRRSQDRDDILTSDGGVYLPHKLDRVFQEGLYAFRLPKPPAAWSTKSAAEFVAALQSLVRRALTAGAGLAVLAATVALYGLMLWKFPFWPHFGLGDPATGW